MAQMDKTGTVFKILVLGDSNVGKTCIVHRFCDESFTEGYISTIGIDFKQKLIKLNEMPVKLQIWDTAGQERFRTLTTAYYRGAMGIIIMYDMTNMESFKHIPYWFKNIEENASPNVVKILVGNKSDAQTQRVIDEEQARKIAEEYNVPFYECSCKSNVNIQKIFIEIANLININTEQRTYQLDYLGQHLENTINSKVMQQNGENWISNRCSNCSSN